jgi:hypothetical protein
MALVLDNARWMIDRIAKAIVRIEASQVLPILKYLIGFCIDQEIHI